MTAAHANGKSALVLYSAPDVRVFEGTNGLSVTVVHISDTHNRLHEYINTVPNGDILIHSGDMCNRRSSTESHVQFHQFLQTFKSFPHTYKVFIAGNHDYCLDAKPQEEIQKLLGPNTYYLLDSSVQLLGLNIYGSPWTTSTQMAFSAPEAFLKQKFANIPKDTHILVTHIPPLAVMDLASKGSDSDPQACNTCGKSHPGYRHWGSPSLRTRVEELGVPVHMFGHVHDENGCRVLGRTKFMNSSMDCYGRCGVVRIYVSQQERPEHQIPQHITDQAQHRPPIISRDGNAPAKPTEQEVVPASAQGRPRTERAVPKLFRRFVS